VREVVPGSTVLELGCNSGLLGVHCALLGAESVTGVDCFESILSSARRIAGAAGVNNEFVTGDLSEKTFVEILAARRPQVVFALSVLHWLTNKQPVLELLSTVPKLFLEGHDPMSVEIAKLRGLGFTNVRILGYSERLRPLYFASR
jgi:2-polyprenyl-3-methyl-5-hydroxy-6-metoxy-1,4-benzoquinol methylase